jgi:hypothetical protein
MKKQMEINQVKEKLQGTVYEISKLDYYIEKSVEISQNIHKYWQSGSPMKRGKFKKWSFRKELLFILPAVHI